MLAGFERGVRVAERFLLFVRESARGREGVDESLELDLVVDRGIELWTDGAHFHATALRGEEDALRPRDHAGHRARVVEQSLRRVASLEAGNTMAVDAAADRYADLAAGDWIGIRVMRLADAELFEEPRELGTEYDLSAGRRLQAVRRELERLIDEPVEPRVALEGLFVRGGEQRGAHLLEVLGLGFRLLDGG